MLDMGAHTESLKKAKQRKIMMRNVVVDMKGINITVPAAPRITKIKVLMRMQVLGIRFQVSEKRNIDA